MTALSRRIVSLLPAATEFVASLGHADALVGVTHECDFPAEAVAPLARVTKSFISAAGTPGAIDGAVRAAAADGTPLFTLDEARIAGVRPDLLVTQAVCDVCAVSEHDVRALAARLDPPPTVVTLAAETLDGMFSDGATIARSLGCDDRWVAIREALTRRLARVHETLKQARAPRPRVVVVEWTDPVYAAGHWVPEMVHRAGGTDVLARAEERSSVHTMAAVVAADPEVVVIAPCGYPMDRAESEARHLARDPSWRWLAGRDLWAVDANALVSRPGPRLVDGIELFARLFHPALFDAPSDAAARRIAL